MVRASGTTLVGLPTPIQDPLSLLIVIKTHPTLPTLPSIPVLVSSASNSRSKSKRGLTYRLFATSQTEQSIVFEHEAHEAASRPNRRRVARSTNHRAPPRRGSTSFATPDRWALRQRPANIDCSRLGGLKATLGFHSISGSHELHIPTAADNIGRRSAINIDCDRVCAAESDTGTPRGFLQERRSSQLDERAVAIEGVWTINPWTPKLEPFERL